MAGGLEASSLLRTAFEVGPDAVLVFDRRRKVVHANAAARRLFAEDIVGLPPGRRAERWNFRDQAGRLMPADVCARFGVNRATGLNGAGHRLMRIFAPPDQSWARVELRASRDDRDPVVLVDVEVGPFGVPELSFVQVTDPASQRFGIDRDDDGQETLLGTLTRNLREERRAAAAGLAPGQVRPGLGLLGRVLEAMEDFCHLFGKDLFLVEPLFYHSALLYERHGCDYLLGRELGARPGAAVAGALAFQLGTTAAQVAPWTPLVLEPFTWFPAVLLCVERLLRQPSVRWTVMAWPITAFARGVEIRVNPVVPLQRSRPGVRQVRRAGSLDVLQFLKHEGLEDCEDHEGITLKSKRGTGGRASQGGEAAPRPAAAQAGDGERPG